jgi:hypothetical protein
MERILGQIYAHSEYLPISAVLEKFNEISDAINQTVKRLDTEIRNEHERNELLQREAKQLADELAVQQKEVDALRKQNAKRDQANHMLIAIGDEQIAKRKAEYGQLLDIAPDEHAMPNSARAMVVTTGHEDRTLTRTPSGKLLVKRDGAMPQVKGIEDFVADWRGWLQDKIIQLRTVQQ